MSSNPAEENEILTSPFASTSTQPCICFSNPGEIDPRLFSLMGVNVKAGAEGSAIGHFGTGLKYAIAVSLRLGGEIIIWQGSKRWSFASQEEEIRGKKFGLIYAKCGDLPAVQLGFTTELGKDWEAWMVYRELYSNCVDEEGEAAASSLALEDWGIPGQTRLLLLGSRLCLEHYNRGAWQLDSPEYTASPGLQVCHWQAEAPKAGFYKGIKVCELAQQPSFSYNLLGTHTLTEDRTLDSWAFGARLRALVVHHVADPAVLEAFMCPKPDTWEASLGWAYLGDRPSEAFLANAKRLMQQRPRSFASGLREALQRYIPKPPPVPVRLTPVEQKMLQKAQLFLAKYDFVIEQPIVVVKSLGEPGMVGQALDGQILLAQEAFGRGTKYVASTLLEEHLHLSLRLEDCSREMQNWLFDKVLSLMEDLTGEPL